MSLSAVELAHLLIALGLLLAAAHAGGYVFKKLRQPPVIGEILGGLCLGPTVFGPERYEAFWQGEPASWAVVGAFYQLGLLLLMFCSGVEMRRSFGAGEKRTTAALTLSGITLPFALALALASMLDVNAHLGPAGNRTALVLVIGIGVAVTSIPVISRILFDLDILDTAFARIILAAAVVEDVVLYVLLAVALSLVGTEAGEAFGLPHALGLHGAGAPALAYHIGVTLAFFALALLAGPLLFGRARSHRLVRDNNPVALLLLLLFAISLGALGLGIAAFLGAFAAGLIANRAGEDASGARETIKRFSFAFPIPVYFAIVGLRLDLVRHFDPLFFLGFLAFACTVKLVSVYGGARLARESHLGALNLSIAMNARGGPGIVLASVAFDARIINEGFYAVLVMLAIVTSSLAGSWLDFVLRRGWPLR